MSTEVSSRSRDLCGLAVLTGRKIYRFAGQGQQQSEHLYRILFMLFRHANTLVGANAALPDHECRFELRRPVGILLRGQCEARKEEIVNENIDQLLAEWWTYAIVLALLREGGFLIQTIEVSAGVGFRIGIAHRFARSPEELLLPFMKMVGFVDIRQQACEDADAVQSFWCDGRVWVREDAPSLQGVQPADRAVYEGLGVLLRRYLGIRMWSV